MADRSEGDPLADAGRGSAGGRTPSHIRTPSEDTLYDGELVDYKLQDVREALTNELGEYYGGVWMSGRGETRRLNMAVTTRAPARTLAAVEAIAATAGLTEHVAFPLVVWSLAELGAGRERFEAVVDGFLPDSPAELRTTSIDHRHNLAAVAIAPELSEAGLGVLAQAITAAGVPVQVTIQRWGWVAVAG
jgi:hypothetical protein